VCLLLAALFAFAPRRPQAAEAPPAFTFLVVGDWGRDGRHGQRDVADQMAKVAAAKRASFVITTGDNFYDDGVPSVSARQWVSSFENIYSQTSLLVPWYPTLGNHDYRGSVQAQIDYSKKSQRWRLPARYHSIQEALPGGGEAEFFFLDTTPFVSEYRRDDEHSDASRQDVAKQLRWLDERLARSKADWRIVVGHHPVYSRGSAHGDTPELIQRVKPLLDRHNVQVYLNGHDHDLQHLVVDGVNYITSGAGSKTRTVGTGPTTRFSLGLTSGFVAMSLTRDSLVAQFIDAKGRERYSFRQRR
jgi:acid phosphatase